MLIGIRWMHVGVACVAPAALTCTLGSNVNDLSSQYGQGGTSTQSGDVSNNIGGAEAGGVAGGTTDAACPVWTYDGDEDGYGDSRVGQVVSCTKPVACPNVTPVCNPNLWKNNTPVGDCSDNDKEVHPGAWDGPYFERRTAGFTSPGLLGRYFNMRIGDDASPSVPYVFERYDQSTSISWDQLSPGREFPNDSFSMQWKGLLHIVQFGSYSFFVNADRCIRVFLTTGTPPKRQVLARGPDACFSGPAMTTRVMQLDIGDYPIEVQYYNDGVNAHMSFDWSGPSFSRQAVRTVSADGLSALPDRCQTEKPDAEKIDYDCNGTPADGSFVDGLVTRSCAVVCEAGRYQLCTPPNCSLKGLQRCDDKGQWEACFNHDCP